MRESARVGIDADLLRPRRRGRPSRREWMEVITRRAIIKMITLAYTFLLRASGHRQLACIELDLKKKDLIAKRSIATAMHS